MVGSLEIAIRGKLSNRLPISSQTIQIYRLWSYIWKLIHQSCSNNQWRWSSKHSESNSGGNVSTKTLMIMKRNLVFHACLGLPLQNHMPLTVVGN